MIADLIRHDLYSTVGRDALVEVVKLCDVVETETVFSLVSHIRAHVPFPAGKSRESPEVSKEMTKHGIRALANTLPPGSMTGAPKKRSCEILHRLEQRDRGVYSGAVGYMDVTGNGAWSVCIRTAFSNEDEDIPASDDSDEMQKWHVGAGGAITVLSDEEQEWEEMMTKLDSVLRGFRVHGNPAAVEATIDRFNELLTEAPDFTDATRVRATIEELQEALEACHT
jgi:para-aminobenzoate synthetase